MKLITFPFQKNISPELPPQQHRPRWHVLTVLGVLATGAGLSLTYFLLRPQPETIQVPPTEAFPLNGQVKGDETNIAAIISGQVEWVTVHEGDDVEQGQVVIQLSSKELQTQLATVRVQLAAAEQHKQQVEAEREVIREKLWDAYLKLRPDESQLDEWVKDADQNILATETQLAEARAELQRAKATSGRTSGESDRPTQSQPKGTVKQQQQINQLEARVRGLEQELRLARGAWVRALSTGLSPYIHSPELDALRQQWVQVLAKLSDAEEAVFQLRSKEQQLEAQSDRLTVTSPLAGIVTDCQIKPGDTVRIGKPLLTIADSDSLYLEAYIPDEAEDNAQSSQQAKVFLNSDPTRPLNVHVVAIESPTSTSNETEHPLDNSPSTSPSILVQLSVDNPNSTTIPGSAVEGELVFVN